MKPTVGRVVLYHANQRWWPAIITTVHSQRQVNLFVCNEDQEEKGFYVKNVETPAWRFNTPTSAVLMSRNNPGGWKLEELLAQMIEELRLKNVQLRASPNPVAAKVQENNVGIANLLMNAICLQQDSLAILDTLGPNKGPQEPRL